MHPEDQKGPRQLAHFFDDVLVALARRNHLVDPARKRMGACCRHLQSRAFRRRHQFAARPVHFDAQFADVIADARPGLHNGLMKFVFYLFRDVRGNFGDDLADVRTKLARCRIYDLKFFLDADGKAVSHAGPSDVVVLGTSRIVSYPSTSKFAPTGNPEGPRLRALSNWRWTPSPFACKTSSHANQALSNRTLFRQVRIHRQVSALL